LVFLQTPAAKTQEISSENAVPASANINQPDFFDGPKDDDGVQTRFRSGKAFPNGEDFRSIVQIFTWNGGRLNGVGLMVSPDQNKLAVMAFENPQHYRLDVQRLTSIHSPVVLETVTSVEVTIFPKHAKPGRYLYIKLDKPVALTKKAAYGLHLRPVELDPVNRLLFACAASTSENMAFLGKYPNVGSGTQYTESGEIETGKSYPRRRNCLTFYTTAEQQGD
jgi:hypothetical protein